MNKQRKGRKPINAKRLCIIAIFVVYFIIEMTMAIQDTALVTGTMSYNRLFEAIDNNEVSDIVVTKSSTTCRVYMKDGNVYEVINPQSDEFIQNLLERGANISIQRRTFSDSVTSILLMLPIVFVLAVFVIYLTNTMIGGSTKMFTLIKPEHNNITFSSIKGLSGTKTEIKFAIEQLQNNNKLKEAGARMCKGILLYGPPGTGKTLIAKAIANEAGVPFISASGSDFNEMFVGVGASRIRHLWDMARVNAPCIVFIDEIDCIGKRRRGGDGASTEYNQTINALLQKMDGLNSTQGILVIGATNRKEDIDKALLRPGRFDRQYFIGPPTNKADRDELVEFYMQGKTLKQGEIDLESASKLLVGLTGAEIEEAFNEAVYVSLMDGRNGVIKASDLDEAVMKLATAGVKQEHTSQRDLEITAVHEAGHTIVSLVLGIDVMKVSIVPYSSGAGGMTVQDRDKNEDQRLKLKSEYENEICVLLAGMVAEQIVYGEHTQGCSNDLEQATKMVYSLITECGFMNTLLNENTLINMGVSHLIEGRVIDDCNKVLNSLKEKTEDILNDRKVELIKLKEKLLVEKTIVNPKLN